MVYPESIQCNYLLKYKPGVFPGKYSLRSFSRFFFFFFKDYSSTVDKKLKRLVLVLKMEIALRFLMVLECFISFTFGGKKIISK